MEHEEFNFPVSGFHRPFPKLKHLAMISLCSRILKNPADQILFDDMPDLLKKECLVMKQRMHCNFSKNWNPFCDYILQSMHNVVWTHFGTVDMVETYHMNKQLIPPNEKLKLACYLCLEDEVINIWTNVCNEPWYIGESLDEKMFAYWMNFCRNIPPGPGDIFDIFKLCVDAGCLSVPSKFYPLAYFWTKLTQAEREEGLELFIHIKYFKVFVMETTDLRVFLLNKMNETQKDYFLKTQPVPLLVSLSQFYYVSDFIKIFRYFLINKNITLPIAFEACVEFYNLLYRDYVHLQDLLGFPFENEKLFRESMILVLQDTCCPRNDLMKTYHLLTKYYDHRYNVLCEQIGCTQIEINNNVVARIVSDFAEYNDSLESTYKQALENKTSDAYSVFMRQFVLSYEHYSAI